MYTMQLRCNTMQLSTDSDSSVCTQYDEDSTDSSVCTHMSNIMMKTVIPVYQQDVTYDSTVTPVYTCMYTIRPINKNTFSL